MRTHAGSVGATRWHLILAECAALALMACADAAPRVPLVGQTAAKSEGSCDVSFTMTIDDHDDELASYGVPDNTETVDVCQTWTGGDYTIAMNTVSSTRPEWYEPDAI